MVDLNICYVNRYLFCVFLFSPYFFLLSPNLSCLSRYCVRSALDRMIFNQFAFIFVAFYSISFFGFSAFFSATRRVFALLAGARVFSRSTCCACVCVSVHVYVCVYVYFGNKFQCCRRGFSSGFIYFYAAQTPTSGWLDNDTRSIISWLNDFLLHSFISERALNCV